MQLIPSLSPPSKKSCEYAKERYPKDVIAGIAIVLAYLIWAFIAKPNDTIGHMVFFVIGIVAGLPFYIYVAIKLIASAVSGLEKGKAIFNAKKYFEKVQEEIKMDAELSFFGSPYFLLFFIPFSIAIGIHEPWTDVRIATIFLIFVLSLNVEKLVIAHLFASGVKK